MKDPFIHVRLTRGDDVTHLKVGPGKLQELMDLANKHFGNPDRILGGPRPVTKMKAVEPLQRKRERKT